MFGLAPVWRLSASDMVLYQTDQTFVILVYFNLINSTHEGKRGYRSLLCRIYLSKAIRGTEPRFPAPGHQLLQKQVCFQEVTEGALSARQQEKPFPKYPCASRDIERQNGI